MRFRLVVITVLLLVSGSVFAQPDKDPAHIWTLQRCVQYAIEHNISIRQDSLNARLARYTLKQSQLSQLPTLSANSNFGRNFGRSVNPTTNDFVDASYNSMTFSGSGSVLLFGWMQVRNAIERNKYNLDASLADLEQLKNDMSVNVVNGFLAAVLAQEQVNISTNQVSLSKAQLTQTRAFADAGRLPELNVAQMESQVATDSANLINAIAAYNSAILDLKTLLNLDLSTPFSIRVPDVEVKDELTVTALEPEEIFQKARTHFGSIKSSELRVNAAEKGVNMAKGMQYPQLSLGYQVGTSVASNYLTVTGYNLGGVQPNGSFVQDTQSSGSVRYLPVYEQQFTPVTATIPFDKQFRNNFREYLYLNLSIPIFNGWQTQYSVKQARINLAQSQLNKYNAELTLKQNVYKAHNNALNSIQKYNAAKRADDAARRALDFARKRYDLGLTSTVDLLVTQNSEFAAAANLAGAKYDLIFKLKLIDYYLGKELKL